MINVLFADDHQIVVDGLKSLLEADMNCVGEANNGDEVMQLLETVSPDVVVLDIEMPGKDGVATMKEIRTQYPAIKVLVLSMHSEHRFISRLLQAGANGYILKERGREEMVTAIRSIVAGKDYFGSEITQAMIDHQRNSNKTTVTNPNLTRRELEVLKEIADGHTTPQIAEKLFIAKTTVDTHRKNLIEKLGLNNSKELVRYAVENDLID